MDLNDRKKKILQAIIDEYIGTAEPVGSRAISKKKELGLSSATIRNEMADLEDMGYLIQPHTSAGRIPSDEGYKFYVNSLMSKYQIGLEAIDRLREELGRQVQRMETMIRKAGFIASVLTEYAAVVTTPETGQSKIRKIDLVHLGGGMVMLIAVTQSGTVKNRVMAIELGDEVCAILAEVLNRELCGLTADEIDFKIIERLNGKISERIDLHPKILIKILDFVYETISSLDEREIYVNNMNSILQYPEYSNVQKAREVFGFLENKANLKKLMSGGGDEISVKIGTETGAEELKDTSLVTVGYTVDGKPGGKIGIIGPKRMNYSKVFASLDVISKQLDSILRLYRDDE